MSCSHEELKLTHEELSVAHENLVLDHALLTSKLSNEGIKTSESSSHGSKDQLQNVANPCDVGKKHISTSCDDLLSMPCTSHIDAIEGPSFGNHPDQEGLYVHCSLPAQYFSYLALEIVRYSFAEQTLPIVLE